MAPKLMVTEDADEAKSVALLEQGIYMPPHRLKLLKNNPGTMDIHCCTCHNFIRLKTCFHTGATCSHHIKGFRPSIFGMCSISGFIFIFRSSMLFICYSIDSRLVSSRASIVLRPILQVVKRTKAVIQLVTGKLTESNITKQ